MLIKEATFDKEATYKVPAAWAGKTRGRRGTFEIAERRKSPRIRPPAALRMRWAGGEGRREVATIIDNISAGGFAARLVQDIPPGARVFALIEFPPAGDSGRGARLAVRGRVLRVEDIECGVSGVAVSIESHRFI